MRRALNQAANAAVKTKGSIFQLQYRRLVPRLGHSKAIWAIAHRLCRLAWTILHEGVEYIEYGLTRDAKALRRRTAKLVRELQLLQRFDIEAFGFVSGVDGAGYGWFAQDRRGVLRCGLRPFAEPARCDYGQWTAWRSMHRRSPTPGTSTEFDEGIDINQT
jgi:hypothetical protein